MSVVTPEIRFFADCHWLMADNIILLRITPMLPYEWSNLRRLFDCKSTFETRSGPFDYWRIRLEFDRIVAGLIVGLHGDAFNHDCSFIHWAR